MQARMPQKPFFLRSGVQFRHSEAPDLDNFYIFAEQQTQNTQKIMKELVAKINAEFEVFAANAEAQVEKGNKAAGMRARKSALEISKLMKEFRKVSVEASK